MDSETKLRFDKLDSSSIDIVADIEEIRTQLLLLSKLVGVDLSKHSK